MGTIKWFYNGKCHLKDKYMYMARPDTSYLKGQGDFSLVKGTSMRNL